MQQPLSNKFASIGHPVDLNIFKKYIHYLKPDKEFKDKLVLKFFEWTPSYKVKDFAAVQFQETQCEGVFIMVPFLPEMKDIKLREVTRKIEQALEIAVQNGCFVAALGGFTSIVLQGQEKSLSEKYNIRLTSGNTLTSAVAIRSIEKIVQTFGDKLSDLSMTIVGASGDIGSACVGYFCDKVRRLSLVARGMDKLKETADRYKIETTCAIDLYTTEQLEAVLKTSDIVIFATSAYSEIVTQEQFVPRTIVCDVSAPQNVKTKESLRSDVFIYHGGIVYQQFPIDPGFDIGLPSENYFYGCQLEGILISLDPSLPDSWGRGNITKDKLERYLQIIDTTNLFTPAFTLEKHVYTDCDTESYTSFWKNSCQIEKCNLENSQL